MQVGVLKIHNFIVDLICADSEKGLFEFRRGWHKAMLGATINDQIW